MNVLLEIGSRCLDALFPVTCLGCNAEGEWVCISCTTSLEFLHNDKCPWCKRTASGQGTICVYCRKKTHISRLVCAFAYEHILVQSIIRGLKYEFLEGLAPWMAERMNILWSHYEGDAFKELVVIPIPLHMRRERERGFNQAELLARNFSQRGGYILDDANLLRIKATESQTELDRDERHKNVKGVFSLKHPEILLGKHVVLIDDVCTTGSTLNEAASVLWRAGVKEISCLVFAHGRFD